MKKRKSLWIILTALVLMVSSSVAPYPVNAASIKETIYIVQFNTNGGSSISPIYDVRYGHTIDLPENPVKTGYWFRGWYVDTALTIKFNSSEKIYRNMTLYAKWEKHSSTPAIMSQTITNGTYTTTVSIDLTGQQYGNACRMNLMVYEPKLVKEVVFTQNKTNKYIGFEFNVEDLVFDDSKPIPTRIKIPAGFSPENSKIIYTTNRKTVAGIPECFINGDNELVFDVYYSGTYVLMEGLDNIAPVVDPAPYLKIDCDSTTLKLNKQMDFNYALMNYAGDDTQFDYKWYSSKPYIASISKEGVLTAKQVGKTIVSCVTTDGTFVATKTITVIGTPVKKIKTNLSTKRIKKGKSFNIRCTVSPSNATVKKLKYTSTNTRIATVTNTGKVRAKKKGTCYIKIVATDGSKKAKKVKVIVT